MSICYPPCTMHYSLSTTHCAPRTTHRSPCTTHNTPRAACHAPHLMCCASTHHVSCAMRHVQDITHYTPHTSHSLCYAVVCTCACCISDLLRIEPLKCGCKTTCNHCKSRKRRRKDELIRLGYNCRFVSTRITCN